MKTKKTVTVQMTPSSMTKVQLTKALKSVQTKLTSLTFEESALKEALIVKERAALVKKGYRFCEACEVKVGRYGDEIQDQPGHPIRILSRRAEPSGVHGPVHLSLANGNEIVEGSPHNRTG
jgi:hypothetical protein